MLSSRSTSEKRWRAGLYGNRAREDAGLAWTGDDCEASARPGQRFVLSANMKLKNIHAFGPAGGWDRAPIQPCLFRACTIAAMCVAGSCAPAAAC
jgi:hypothetical protein